ENHDSGQERFRAGQPNGAKDPIGKKREDRRLPFGKALKSGIARVPVACFTDPASMNRIAVMIPWLKSWKIAPWTPMTVRLEAPSRTNPMWPTELYAIRRFRSTWARHTNAA